jgi:hypothetical protein
MEPSFFLTFGKIRRRTILLHKVHDIVRKSLPFGRIGGNLAIQ